MKKKRGEEKKKRRREEEEEEEKKGMKTRHLYGNYEYGMLCFCLELVWKCLYGY